MSNSSSSSQSFSLKPVGYGSKYSKAPSSSDYMCTLCESKPAQYTCPKCLKLYCSLDCYKGPNHVKCSKAFYEGEVKGNMEISKQDQFKMVKILENFNKADDDWKYELPERLQQRVETIKREGFGDGDDDEKGENS